MITNRMVEERRRRANEDERQRVERKRSFEREMKGTFGQNVAATRELQGTWGQRAEHATGLQQMQDQAAMDRTLVGDRTKRRGQSMDMHARTLDRQQQGAHFDRKAGQRDMALGLKAMGMARPTFQRTVDPETGMPTTTEIPGIDPFSIQGMGGVLRQDQAQDWKSSLLGALEGDAGSPTQQLPPQKQQTAPPPQPQRQPPRGFTAADMFGAWSGPVAPGARALGHFGDQRGNPMGDRIMKRISPSNRPMTPEQYLPEWRRRIGD